MSAATQSRPQAKAPFVDPAIEDITPAPKPIQRDQEEALYDLLEQVKTICTLIAHNFGGDGSFDEPSKAPGLAPLFACVADLTQAADQLATRLHVPSAVANKIEQALGLAKHLKGLSQETLILGPPGFRIGDGMVAMGYWTIEKLVESAIRRLSSEVQA